MHMSFKYYNTESLEQTRAGSEVGLEEVTIQKHMTHSPHTPKKKKKLGKLIGVLKHLPGGCYHEGTNRRCK